MTFAWKVSHGHVATLLEGKSYLTEQTKTHMSSTKWEHDFLMTFLWLSQNFLTILSWLSHEFLMTV